MRLTRDEMLLIAAVLIALAFGMVTKSYRDRQRSVLVAMATPTAKARAQARR